MATMSASNKLTQMNGPAIFDIPRLVEAARHQRWSRLGCYLGQLRARERDSEQPFL